MANGRYFISREQQQQLAQWFKGDMQRHITKFMKSSF